MVHFEDKGMYPKVHWWILEDSGRFLARMLRAINTKLHTVAWPRYHARVNVYTVFASIYSRLSILICTFKNQNLPFPRIWPVFLYFMICTIFFLNPYCHILDYFSDTCIRGNVPTLVYSTKLESAMGKIIWRNLELWFCVNEFYKSFLQNLIFVGGGTVMRVTKYILKKGLYYG